jgi:hypothetical protein
MITISIFWALVLALFQTSDDPTRDEQIRKPTHPERQES